ncbi:MAG: hypothetical protein L0H73_12785 [Nitrococcus sp.]|nr:hypothetical protein [Nitrococcus sp.]
MCGQRQLVFVSGEAGIGKSALHGAFLAQLRQRKTRAGGPANTGLWLGHGQCIQHNGPGEAYLPLLEVLGRWCQAPGAERLVELLRRYAPSWLARDGSEGDTALLARLACQRIR